ncbi:hypothetical protein C343_04458 [Cryptococcus neoformans C23]|uniref:Inhibitor I9 domain-containing protein n=2 Tax=Cryptococcus neoformans TaxID=5207 RepID=A0A854QA60_CRYNE|nr:hypothetical protein CNAG_03114 [Cryptococcus neoformans var. grubii H99]AUB26243.1 hypothetical protein CKF44_03114 [Cryptococcus neoformans var. grubii]OWT38421.1 hypothetical protein C362_03771 [Cryptococcus neoformans var. grubii Bt1]OWZ30224.1 hypothetical protein C347_04505 [Cryptococcus neoformans var. grubii AD2-60a]OWZ38187.1 hypothetical protein C353_04358 [Cryptococcus neoformans var. grubii AD1-83a]OWZ38588.1 hypothetical protein C356_04238 [Cryptococcus neoformans var. grubii c|eukprot:XP_012050835.1 hypothetical protein CNAG_03114 [Cryptococcus neoformans var. grubii H99]
MQINARPLYALILLVTVSFLAYAYYHFPSTQLIALDMPEQNIIVQFKKTSSSDERQKAISELTSKGAKIVNDDNVDSKLMPFITVSYPKSDFSALENQFGGGSHNVINHLEADQEVRIQ